MELFVEEETYSKINLVALCEAMNKYSWANKYSRWETDGKELNFQVLDQNTEDECIFKPMPTKPLIWYRKKLNGQEKTIDPCFPCGDISCESQLFFNPDECINVPIDVLADEFGEHISMGSIKIAMFSDLNDEACSMTTMHLEADGSFLKFKHDHIPFSVEETLDVFGNRIF